MYSVPLNQGCLLFDEMYILCSIVRRCVPSSELWAGLWELAWVVGCGQEEKVLFLSYVVVGSKLGMPWKGSGSSCFEDKAQEIVE
jgi:hypothetical protein